MFDTIAMFRMKKKIKSTNNFFDFFVFSKIIRRHAFDVFLHFVEQFDEFLFDVSTLIKKFIAKIENSKKNIVN